MAHTFLSSFYADTNSLPPFKISPLIPGQFASFITTGPRAKKMTEFDLICMKRESHFFASRLVLTQRQNGWLWSCVSRALTVSFPIVTLHSLIWAPVEVGYLEAFSKTMETVLD